MIECAMCDSLEFTLLGMLGNTAHLRCCCCGWDTSCPADALEDLTETV